MSTAAVVAAQGARLAIPPHGTSKTRRTAGISRRPPPSVPRCRARRPAPAAERSVHASHITGRAAVGHDSGREVGAHPTAEVFPATGAALQCRRIGHGSASPSSVRQGTQGRLAVPEQPLVRAMGELPWIYAGATAYSEITIWRIINPWHSLLPILQFEGILPKKP